MIENRFTNLEMLLMAAATIIAAILVLQLLQDWQARHGNHVQTDAEAFDIMTFDSMIAKFHDHAYMIWEPPTTAIRPIPETAPIDIPFDVLIGIPRGAHR